MRISRDRYLDDTAVYHVALTLETRTGEMHSLLSNLDRAQRDLLGDVLVRALEEIQTLLAPHRRELTHERT